ncbi:cytochrome c oxidase subunit II [Spirosoma sp. KUDC1026]|uniref:cytochrome c oxidase subunit II n=1 Tax=Spirosoma sp. KUDC1026 TaxID=2745947 RepID=UPI00159BB491|nr:cytochrome c oxidase subunit II [Spirosoma sp. KUDC1026]QKZ11480.1 cytochrome c oxidase subunit II [Spirosoma sp. KUDC1026]
MVYIIAILSVIFLGLAIMVVSRMAAVVKSASGSVEEGQIGMSNKINGALFLVFLVLGIIGAIWSYLHSVQYFLPEASTEHGRRTDFLFWLTMGIITAAFVITNTLLFTFAWKYQYKKGHRAAYYPENHKLELIWTVIPAVVMAVLVFSGWRAWRDIMSEAPADAQVVEIVGKQFNWIVRYPGVDDNKLGAYNYKLINSSNETGIDYTDEASFDDFTSPSELHIPVNKPVLLKIRARDVLHSVFIPHLRVKMDAVPGMPTRFWFVADKTTDEMRNVTGNPDFKYEIACTEVCGRGHFSMKINLVVEDEASWQAWCKEQKPLLNTTPELADRIPTSLKAKAAKYLPTEGTQEAAAPADSTTARVQPSGGASLVTATIR